MTNFSMNTLLDDLVEVLSDDATLVNLVPVIAKGTPDVKHVSKRKRGASISVVSGGMKTIDGNWREATVYIVLYTTLPSRNGSDDLMVRICDVLDSIITSNPRPGSLSSSVSGTLSEFESESMNDEENPQTGTVVYTVKYKVFR